MACSSLSEDMSGSGSALNETLGLVEGLCAHGGGGG